MKPQLEVKRRRVGGATYQVPVEVKPRRANTLAIRWIVGYSPASGARRPWPSVWPTSCSTPPTASGASLKRKEDMHKMAEANKAFAHYRW